MRHGSAPLTARYSWEEAKIGSTSFPPPLAGEGQEGGRIAEL